MDRQLNYKMLSKTYDLGMKLFFLKKATSPLQALLNLLPAHPIHILDVCTGTGSNAIKIASERPEDNLIGIDLSKEMLAITNAKILKLGLKNYRTEHMNATGLEFREGQFDVVIISLVLHEMGYFQAEKILSEAKRVLKAGGKIIVIEWKAPKKLFQRGMFTLIKQMEQESFERFLQTDFETYFKKSGLIINQVMYCDYTQVFELFLEG